MTATTTKTVFLGGACGNNFAWRANLIGLLTGLGVEPEQIFNPQLGPGQWNEAAQKLEDTAKRDATINLYVIADPQEPENHFPAYSLLEATFGLFDDQDSVPASSRTVVVFDSTGMPPHAAKVCKKAMADLQARFPDAICTSLEEAAPVIASRLK